MKKLLFVIFLFLLVGCENQKFEKNKSITEYTLKKYEEKLKKEDVKFLKCWPQKDGSMRAIYTTVHRDNSFPATIRLDYINKTFNVYFDTAYLNSPKDELLKDIDECMLCWEKLKDAKKSWK